MHGADNIDPIEIAIVQSVLGEGTGGVIDCYEIAVDQSDLEGVGVEIVVLGVVEADVAGEVCHVKIDVDEFFR
jgi:hypothetical protein